MCTYTSVSLSFSLAYSFSTSVQTSKGVDEYGGGGLGGQIGKRLKEQFPMIKNEVFGRVSVEMHLGAAIAAMIHSSNACHLIKDDYTDDAYV